MAQYGYQPEASEGGQVSRIVIEPNYHPSDEFPGKLSVMMLDSNDALVDVWSANDITEAASLLMKYGTEHGYEIEKGNPKPTENDGAAPEPPFSMGGDVGGS